ncbi:MAG: S8 family serine peptidase [Isosphaeraceae bacterium]|nr:S8 family serine peptidase [Isosphaeraceae bacterium]
MGWTHETGRSQGRRRRFRVEALEDRRLLSTVDPSTHSAPALASPIPAGGGGGSTTGTDYQSITGATNLRNAYGVDGKGHAVAVIDTGVDYDHPALGGGFGGDHKVVAGWDFGQKDADPKPTWQHGTAVAGLIASTDPAHLGIAPGADIVALRVFDDANRGDFNRIADALQWVVDNHQRYDITVVNISLSDGNNYSLNWFANDGGVGQRITRLIRELEGLSIPVVTATGNSFNGQQGQGFTSIIAESISVTATDSSDKLVGNAQRLGKSVGGAHATDVAAPGAGVVAPTGTSGFAAGDGTSFSAPIVSGGIVLLQQIYKARFGKLPSVDQLESWIQSGADMIRDAATGIEIGRLDLASSAGLIPAAPTPPSRPVGEPAPTPALPAPAAPAAPSATETVAATAIVGTNVFYNGAPVNAADKGRAMSDLLQSLFKGQVKTVRIWGSRVGTAKPTESKSVLDGATKLRKWNVGSASALPTGRLSVRKSLQQRGRGR